MPVESFDNTLSSSLRDPEIASEYLQHAFRDGKDVFLLALHDVAKAYGVSNIANQTGLNRESLYKMFKNGNPRMDTLSTLLSACGLELTFVPKSPVDSPLPITGQNPVDSPKSVS